MMDRIPRRLRVAFLGADSAADTTAADALPGDDPATVDFVAYGQDCVLSGRTVLDGDRLTDMLNDHDEYALIGVTVERFDGMPPISVDDVVVSRDELWMVHASGPRGNLERRHRTVLQHIAVKMGPYEVRGFYHGLPGTDPDSSMRRRKAMIPLTSVRIEYTIGGETREVLVETVIVNRDHVDWLKPVEPDRVEFPAEPQHLPVDLP
jgi:hypothetical protein